MTAQRDRDNAKFAYSLHLLHALLKMGLVNEEEYAQIRRGIAAHYAVKRFETNYEDSHTRIGRYPRQKEVTLDREVTLAARL